MGSAIQSHMWTVPSLQGVLQCFDQIACVHMSGLLMRSHMNAGQDGFRDTRSKQTSDLLKAVGTDGVSRVVDRLITPSAHYLASSGTGSARLQLSCSPCLADLKAGSAETIENSVTVSGILYRHHLPCGEFCGVPR